MKTFYINKKKNNHVNEYVNSDGDHYSDLISYSTREQAENLAFEYEDDGYDDVIIQEILS